jgi:hypothetical protein
VVSSYTEVLAISEAVMPTGPLGSLTLCKARQYVGATRGSFETIPAGSGDVPKTVSRPPALPEIYRHRAIKVH